MDMPLAIVKNLIPVSEERIYNELDFQARLSGIELKPFVKEVKINLKNKEKATRALSKLVAEIRGEKNVKSK